MGGTIPRETQVWAIIPAPIPHDTCAYILEPKVPRPLFNDQRVELKYKQFQSS